MKSTEMPKCSATLLSIFILCNLVSLRQCLDIKQDIQRLRAVLTDITSFLKVTISEDQPNCVQMQCKFICFNGKVGQIVNDIREVDIASKSTDCDIIDELCIYNYEFPDNIIYRGFLGAYTHRVRKLYVASSNITDIGAGAFAGGVFEKLSFENLKLQTLHRHFFDGISADFKSLIIIQKDTPIRTIGDNFLDNVKYQIKAMTMQIGVSCIRNLTASGSLLNNLLTVDFSNNQLSGDLTSTAFKQLSVVEELNLSNSQITYLPENIFADCLASLVYLDISNNRLLTISRTIFGKHDIPSDLKILASGNNWECSCDLSIQMHQIFEYQPARTNCVTPDRYQNWTVLDERLCNYDDEYTNNEMTVTPGIMPPCANCKETTKSSFITRPSYIPTKPTTSSHDENSTSGAEYDVEGGESGGETGQAGETTGGNAPPIESDMVLLECSSVGHLERAWQIVKWPMLIFDISSPPTLRVDVVIESEDLNNSFGLIWFSKVTKEFYNMEVNYKDYGLGCYGSITHVTRVDDLLPDVAYTFCLVLKNKLTISPFSCKSIHIDGNMDVNYSAWLSRDMRVTGISLVVFGIVMFTFVGILMAFLILKRKPTLLRGSKRVATTNASRSEIVVFPKDKTLQDFRQKEQMLAKRHSKSTVSCTRRNSTDSIDSNQSYMNANLYEIIPAYLKFNEEPFLSNHAKLYQSTTEEPDSYLVPLSTESSTENLVRYAEIPQRAKRISNDPLPEVPTMQAPLTLPLCECPDRSDTLSAIILDSQV